MKFSVIIPVYNRPEEIAELLQSLFLQEEQPMEVIIVEDGSTQKCENLLADFSGQILIRYFFIPNIGQGFARNYGMNQANGDFFVLFDSDCIIPKQYFRVLKEAILSRELDAFGGPDAAGLDFSPIQKAMNYSMTSVLTTGGIRGKLKDVSKYQARGYNMGMSRKAFHQSKGFIDPNRGEDIELSLRLKKLGFRLELIEEAYVYHKRKNTLASFFKQSYTFGQNRINISRFHADAIKIVHLLPLFFLLYWFCLLLGIFVFPDSDLLISGIVLLGIWKISILIHSTLSNNSLIVGVLSVITSFGQLSAYGLGLLSETVKKFFKG
ncbi:Glycosyltransferase, GT2 family [Belliella buryatensis]|uniref:Glycosyltransferase, GT2 family n=1 Tax=Belliella buryatensis TaxID=1500549 RepID=A0A239GDI6_9BACT|nr:glycosyltransferase [Belliella buryatensis]SNS66985.1 Glycosyltransferase, GT2 family [Belliella buryatensis]